MGAFANDSTGGWAGCICSCCGGDATTSTTHCGGEACVGPKTYTEVQRLHHQILEADPPEPGVAKAKGNPMLKRQQQRDRKRSARERERSPGQGRGRP